LFCTATINVLSDDGPVMSETCRSLIIKNINIIVYYITIVGICYINLWTLKYNHGMGNVMK